MPTLRLPLNQLERLRQLHHRSKRLRGLRVGRRLHWHRRRRVLDLHFQLGNVSIGRSELLLQRADVLPDVEHIDIAAICVQLTAFTLRGVMYRVRVIRRWRLATRWWEPAESADRNYFRVITSDQQIFELYYEAAPTAQVPNNKRWILDICQD